MGPYLSVRFRRRDDEGQHFERGRSAVSCTLAQISGCVRVCTDEQDLATPRKAFVVWVRPRT
jgi:hypothetical protein